MLFVLFPVTFLFTRLLFLILNHITVSRAALKLILLLLDDIDLLLQLHQFALHICLLNDNILLHLQHLLHLLDHAIQISCDIDLLFNCLLWNLILNLFGLRPLFSHLINWILKVECIYGLLIKHCCASPTLLLLTFLAVIIVNFKIICHLLDLFWFLCQLLSILSLFLLFQ